MTDKKSKKLNPLGLVATMRTTLMTIGAVVVVALAFNYLDISIFGGPVIVRAEVPSPIGIGADPNFLPIDVTVSLENNTKKLMSLEVANPCDIVEWAIFTSNGVFVQAKPLDETCAQFIISGELESGETTQQIITIDLDAKRFQPDYDYVLLLKFWGHETKKRFSTVASLS